MTFIRFSGLSLPVSNDEDYRYGFERKFATDLIQALLLHRWRLRLSKVVKLIYVPANKLLMHPSVMEPTNSFLQIK